MLCIAFRCFTLICSNIILYTCNMIPQTPDLKSHWTQNAIQARITLQGHGNVQHFQTCIGPTWHVHWCARPFDWTLHHAPLICKCTAANSLSRGRCRSNFKSITYKHMLRIKFMSTSCELLSGEYHRIPAMSTSKSFYCNKTLHGLMLSQIYVALWRH